jgi:anti-anti-sigma regulatory factor
MSGIHFYRTGDKLYLANVDAHRQAVETLLSDPDISCIVLDLENIVRCDTHGVRLIVTLLRTAQSSGKRLLLYRPASTIRAMLNDIGIDQPALFIDSLPE